MRIKLGLFILTVLLASGCENEESRYSSSLDYKNSTVPQVSYDMANFLEVGNFNQKSVGVLRYVVGSITNTGTTHIDEIGDMAIFDESGSLITVKKIVVNLSPNDTMYFEELVGQDVQGHSIKLSGF
jgi:hypothetical protein